MLGFSQEAGLLVLLLPPAGASGSIFSFCPRCFAAAATGLPPLISPRRRSGGASPTTSSPLSIETSPTPLLCHTTFSHPTPLLSPALIVPPPPPFSPFYPISPPQLADRKPKPTSFFKTLIDQEVTVELKNDIKITGTLKSVDQYLNIKLEGVSVHEELRYPHLSAVRNVFIRGSVVRYVHLPSNAVDVTLLEDAARRGTSVLFIPVPFRSSAAAAAAAGGGSGYVCLRGGEGERGSSVWVTNLLTRLCRGCEPGLQGPKGMNGGDVSTSLQIQPVSADDRRRDIVICNAEI